MFSHLQKKGNFDFWRAFEPVLKKSNSFLNEEREETMNFKISFEIRF